MIWLIILTLQRRLDWSLSSRRRHPLKGSSPLPFAWASFWTYSLKIDSHFKGPSSIDTIRSRGGSALFNEFHPFYLPCCAGFSDSFGTAVSTLWKAVTSGPRSVAGSWSEVKSIMSYFWSVKRKNDKRDNFYYQYYQILSIMTVKTPGLTTNLFFCVSF